MISSLRHHPRSRVLLAVIVTVATLLASTVADAQRPASPASTGFPIASAAPESAGMSAARLTRLTIAFKKEIDDKKLPGAVMMVARKGKLVYATALGVRDPKGVDPMRADTIFRIYSMTKPMVSVAAMILVENGILTEDQIAEALRLLVDDRTSKIRCHGDYHLGQVLKTADAFLVIDFEGEPARPLAERRARQSALRDVAGMLRSIDYAARVSHRQGGLAEPEAWVPVATESFLAGYGFVSATEAGLLGAFLVEKACYEVRYEADNRPDWAWLPLEALERFARHAA